jgi:hypothetical protein
MRIATLTRTDTGPDGTFGILNIENKFLCLTLEPPDNGNQKDKSCIPVGEYKVKPFISHRFKKVYKIMNVPKRSGILFHKGNTIKDTTGCILLGFRQGVLGDLLAILDSATAFMLFERVIRRHSFTLIIKEDY